MTKVTMWLDDELARKIRALAGWDGEELGAIAGPILSAALKRVWLVDGRRPADPPAEPPAVRIAEEPEGEGAAPAGLPAAG